MTLKFWDLRILFGSVQCPRLARPARRLRLKGKSSVHRLRTAVWGLLARLGAGIEAYQSAAWSIGAELGLPVTEIGGASLVQHDRCTGRPGVIRHRIIGVFCTTRPARARISPHLQGDAKSPRSPNRPRTPTSSPALPATARRDSSRTAAPSPMRSTSRTSRPPRPRRRSSKSPSSSIRASIGAPSSSAISASAGSSTRCRPA